MHLPFTPDEFLDVFGRYNLRLWPAVIALWVITAAAALIWLRNGRLSGRVAAGLLAVHWGWSAVAYHWFFFRDINPAATAFAALFAIQAALLTWQAAVTKGAVRVSSTPRGIVGAGLVLYGLAYPFLGLALGLDYPRLPLFAVPCPTVLITAGFLVTSTGMPRYINVAPIIWAAIGSSAAFVLGMRADLALIVAGVALTLNALVPQSAGVTVASVE